MRSLVAGEVALTYARGIQSSLPTVSGMWKYLYFVIALWVFEPFVRRVYEMEHGFSQVSPFAIVPLASLMPIAIAIAFGGRLQRVPFPFAAAAWCWTGAQSYGLALSIAAGNPAAGLYGFGQFMLPLAVGIWIATDDLPSRDSYRRISSCILVLAVIASVYGVFQFMTAPPWDAFWLRNANINSAGYPFPFQIRVFSTLNGPVACAVFLVAAILIFVPRLTIKHPWYLVAVSVCITAFALTLVRAAWLALAFGLVTYFFFTPNKMRLITIFGGVSLIAFSLIAILPVVTGDSKIGDSLTSRVDTLSDLDSDRSAQERRNLYTDGFANFQNAPMGQGLGSIGLASKLNGSSGGVDFDSGILARLTELGIPGYLLFLVGAGLALWTSFQAWYEFRHAPDISSIAIIAMAYQFALLAMEVSGDSHSGFPAVLAWSLAGITARSLSPQRRPVAVKRHVAA